MKKVIFGLLLLGAFSAHAEEKTVLTEDYMIKRIRECWAEFDSLRPNIHGGVTGANDPTLKAIQLTTNCKRMQVAFHEESKKKKAVDCHTEGDKTVCSIIDWPIKKK